MSNEYDAFQQAMKELKAKRETAAMVVGRVTGVSEKLNHPNEPELWRFVRLRLPDVDYPPGFMGDEVDLSRFPTAKELAQSVADYQHALYGAQSAYDQIPEDQRAGLERRPRR